MYPRILKSRTLVYFLGRSFCFTEFSNDVPLEDMDVMPDVAVLTGHDSPTHVGLLTTDLSPIFGRANINRITITIAPTTIFAP